MRILAGSLKGRSITRPALSSVRPMTDKVRGALFDILGDINDLYVLDAYAGSGAVGLEALSRGAVHVVGVESTPKVAQIIRSNISALGVLDRYKLYTTTVRDWAVRQDSARFNLVIADPPYAKIDEGELNACARVLQSGGILVVSHSSRIEAPALQSLEFVQTRVYGDSSLSFYRRS